MGDDRQLIHLPQQDEKSLVSREAKSSLAARGREDVLRALARKLEPKVFAAVMLGDRWGFIDCDGNFAIDPVHHGLLPFSDGLAVFAASPLPDKRAYFGRAQTNEIGDDRTGQFGFLNIQGEIVVEPRFRSVRCFSEGLAAIQIDRKWGYINKDDSIAIQPKYAAVGDFREGIATAYRRCEKFWCRECGFIDKSGEFVIDPRFDRCDDFSEGLAAAWVGDKCGYIDRTGRMVIEPRFEEGESFRDGIAQVKLNGRPSIIDRSGCVVHQFEDTGFWAYRGTEAGFTNGIVRVFGHSKRYERSCYVDLRLRSILRDRSLAAVDRFSEGLGEVSRPVKSDHFGIILDLKGYVDALGDIKIEPQFLSASVFRNGLACVSPRVKNDDFRSSGRWKDCFIDVKGNRVTEPRFASAGDFSNGMARVVEVGHKRYGYINVSGKTIVPCQFDDARDFETLE